MKSTREKIISSLLAHPDSTINDLAEAVKINGISVRHHLTNLQADGLVAAEEERHGVGRPRLVYKLTDLGMEKFPTNYLKLTNRLLDQLKTILPPEKVNDLFAEVALNLAKGYKEDIAKLPIEDQLNAVKAILSQEGFIIEWEKKGKDYLIRNISCPYYHVGLAHPEVCNIDRTIISTLLSRPVKLHECLLDGKTNCTYIVEVELKEDLNA